jgi:hypothetical protein
MTRLFDVYVAVDWSARNSKSPVKESKDAIWYAFQDQRGKLEVLYKRSRHALQQDLLERLQQWKQKGKQVLVGFDFSFGYPAGFAKACFPENAEKPWRMTWNWLEEKMKDDEGNKNNRWEVAEQLNQKCGPKLAGPFWGSPNNRKDTDFLTGKRAGFDYPYDCGDGIFLQRMRETDRRSGGVQEVWKLYGVGCVGSQTLTGIPVLHQLRFHEKLKDQVRVWPFETGFAAADTAQIVFAEIFPSSVFYLPETKMANGDPEIPDRRQVRSVVHRMAELDKAGLLKAGFDTPLCLTEEEKQRCIEEEGWILPLY